MKNLKKVLSLGLALVMLLGMMSFASAADAASSKLADMDKVTNKDEVSLLVDLGVISGIKEGDQMLYKPESNIQRDAWAKMVYYVMQGNADYKVLENSSNLKDIANNWANGCISYLATQKIVSGDDLGNYNPLRSIKVNEAAKTLLTAAGWDASDRDYTGASWSGSVMSDAKRFGLMNGIALTANDTLTRDAAAKMIVNALDLEVVQAVRKPMYVGTGVDKFVDSYKSMQTTLGHQAFGLVKVTGVVDELDADGNIVFRNNVVNTGASTTGKTLATTSEPLNAIKGDASMVGQNVVIYIKASADFTGTGEGKITLDGVGAVDSVISSTPVLGGMTVLATVTGGGKWAELKDKDDKDHFVAEIADDAAYYVNGAKADTAYTTDLKGGEVAELCDTTGDGVADLVRVFNWKVAVVGDDGVKTTTKKDVTTVTVDGVFVGSKNIANVVGYESLEAGDVVLFYTDNTNWVIEKAATVTGAVQSMKDGKLTVGGKTYAKGGIFDTTLVDGALFGGWESDDDTAYIWALDKNGDVCHYAAPAGVKVETKNAIVLVTDSAKGNGGSGLGISSSSSDQAKAQLLFTDGTVEVVDVAKVGETALKDATWDNDGKWTELDALAGALVDYSVADKKYTLTATENVETITSGTEISAAVKFDGTNKANVNTLFIVAKVTGTGDDAKVAYTTYTGFANVPGMTTTEDGLVLNDNGYAKIVYLTTDKFAGDAPAGYIYVTSESLGLVAGQSYYTAAIINADGELDETTKVAKDVVTATGLFQIGAVDENGVITELTDKNADLKALSVDLEMANGVFSFDGKDYQYDNKTKVIIIDLADDGSYSDVTVTGAGKVAVADDYASAQAVVVGDEGKIADTVIVIRTAAAE